MNSTSNIQHSTLTKRLRLFVTGSTGFIGSHFLNAALAAGHDVIAFRRSEASKPRVPILGFRSQQAAESGVGSRESGVGSRESGVGSQRPAISNQQSAISNQQSAISNQQSTINNQQSTINNQQSTINNQQSGDSNQQSSTPAIVGYELLRPLSHSASAVAHRSVLFPWRLS